jgi:hypothetical protein
MSTSDSINRAGWVDSRPFSYASGVGTAALAAAGAMSIVWCTTSPTFASKILTIGVLGVGQSLVFGLTSNPPIRYRVASSVALLSIFLSAFVPGLLQTSSVSTATALALAAAGSLPMWAVAVWRFALARNVIRPT